ncbi:hypothetical protein GWK50_19340 (plasmid) [Acidovorax sp. 210-6]|uniref:hypothetical protein n=1 Tax=Acidovorax sp. 210-6 TaxID=2699468 RepID=UPI00138A4B2A|nr:hypothetical protein [Acidovorax sp. 210-6]NCU67980.1 hypothetical protein [Acidovorax sp. 210-6]
MKNTLLAATIVSLVLSGCANDKFSAGTVTSADYIASGQVGPTKAWVYAQRTLFEGREGSNYKFSRLSGEGIATTKVGNIYRMHSLERDFIATDGLHTMRYVLSPATWTFSETGATYDSGFSENSR